MQVIFDQQVSYFGGIGLLLNFIVAWFGFSAFLLQLQLAGVLKILPRIIWVFVYVCITWAHACDYDVDLYVAVLLI